MRDEGGLNASAPRKIKRPDARKGIRSSFAPGSRLKESTKANQGHYLGIWLALSVLRTLADRDVRAPFSRRSLRFRLISFNQHVQHRAIRNRRSGQSRGRVVTEPGAVSDRIQAINYALARIFPIGFSARLNVGSGRYRARFCNERSC